MEVHDKLKVKVLEVQNLFYVPGLPLSGYVEITVGPNKLKTHEVLYSLNPSFGEVMLIFDHILGDNVESILVHVNNYDPTADIPRCLGRVVIPMDTFYNAPRISFVQWYELSPGVIGDRLNNSRIQLEIEYDHAVDSDIFDVKDSKHKGDSQLDKPPNFLQATVLSASLPYSLHKVDAFVEIKVDSFKKVTKVRFTKD